MTRLIYKDVNICCNFVHYIYIYSFSMYLDYIELDLVNMYERHFSINIYSWLCQMLNVVHASCRHRLLNGLSKQPMCNYCYTSALIQGILMYSWLLYICV